IKVKDLILTPCKIEAPKFNEAISLKALQVLNFYSSFPEGSTSIVDISRINIGNDLTSLLLHLCSSDTRITLSSSSCLRLFGYKAAGLQGYVIGITRYKVKTPTSSVNLVAFSVALDSIVNVQKNNDHVITSTEQPPDDYVRDKNLPKDYNMIQVPDENLE
nr:hypothetical protein [Tanacetum cinerariifolium]